MERVNWWQRQIDLGWKGPMGRPRGSVDAEFPLVSNVWYRVSMNPQKGHLLMPGTFQAYCGLELAPDEQWLVDSGYDQWYWIVEDHRETGHCGDCLRWKNKWHASAAGHLPVDSPVSADEWAKELGPEQVLANRRLDGVADLVASWFGPGARRVEEEQ